MRALRGIPEILISPASGTASRWSSRTASAVVVRKLVAAFVCCSGVVGIHSAAGAERLRMVGPPPADEAVKELMESVASSCNHRQFTEFMSYFTSKRASAIRGRMESLFIEKDIMIEIMDVIVLSHSDNRIVFGVRYACGEKAGPKRFIASKVTAVKVADSWKLDGEQVQSKREEADAVATASPQRFEFGVGGVVVFNPNDDFLPLDIPRRPGGCVNGRCAIR